MPHLQIQDARYYYQVEGKGEPLVLIAGYCCDHSFWKAVSAELVRHFKVLTFDNRGVGATEDNGAPLSLEQMAEETVQLFSMLQIRKPVLVGHSMGGMIAQIIGKKHPDAIRNLIVLNSSGKSNPRTLFALESLLNLVIAKAPREAVIEAGMGWFFSPRFLEDPKKVAAFKDNLPQQKVEDIARQLEALKKFDIARIPGLVQVPSLLLHSKEDILCLPEESARLVPHFFSVQQKSLEGGHSSPIETPLEVAREIVGNF